MIKKFNAFSLLTEYFDLDGIHGVLFKTKIFRYADYSFIYLIFYEASCSAV